MKRLAIMPLSRFVLLILCWDKHDIHVTMPTSILSMKSMYNFFPPMQDEGEGDDGNPVTTQPSATSAAGAQSWDPKDDPWAAGSGANERTGLSSGTNPQTYQSWD